MNQGKNIHAEKCELYWYLGCTLLHLQKVKHCQLVDIGNKLNINMLISKENNDIMGNILNIYTGGENYEVF